MLYLVPVWVFIEAIPASDILVYAPISSPYLGHGTLLFVLIETMFWQTTGDFGL